MNAATQNIITAAILLLAASYLAWRSYRTLRGKKTGCGCDTCPAVKSEAKKPSLLLPEANHPGP